MSPEITISDLAVIATHRRTLPALQCRPAFVRSSGRRHCHRRRSRAPRAAGMAPGRATTRPNAASRSQPSRPPRWPTARRSSRRPRQAGWRCSRGARRRAGPPFDVAFRRSGGGQVPLGWRSHVGVGAARFHQPLVRAVEERMGAPVAERPGERPAVTVREGSRLDAACNGR